MKFPFGSPCTLPWLGLRRLLDRWRLRDSLTVLPLTLSAIPRAGRPGYGGAPLSNTVMRPSSSRRMSCWETNWELPVILKLLFLPPSRHSSLPVWRSISIAEWRSRSDTSRLPFFSSATELTCTTSKGAFLGGDEYDSVVL